MGDIKNLSIPAMKCNGCASAISKALDNQMGVIRSEVNLASKSVMIETDIALDVLLDVIKTAGFEATELTPTQQG